MASGERVEPVTRVVIVDDHQTLVDLLRLALSAESDIDVVGTAGNVLGRVAVGRADLP